MREESFGIIPLKKTPKGWQVLLIRHGQGHWAFPKGHKEKDEEPVITAARELKEETGLEIARFISKEPLQEHYFFTKGHMKVSKTVTYFLAEVKGEVVLQQEEVSDYKWLSLKEAEEIATFNATKELCRSILKRLE